MIAFGPVPSRRLGQSLGINNIPPKHCTYDCVYCQVGHTANKSPNRRPFYAPEEVFQAVRQKVREVEASGGHMDFVTLVPDGEPTLDIHLGKIIGLLRPLNYKIAVISNASLIWREDVRNELAGADYVSLKMDSTEESCWRKINRPNPQLILDDILNGALTFKEIFQGILATETMLIKGINDHETSLRNTAEYLSQLKPTIAYLTIPTRPTSESWAKTPDEQTLNQAYQIFNSLSLPVEYLTGFSEETFAPSGNVIEDLLNITAVHPMRESEVLDLLKKAGISEEQLGKLVTEEKLVRVLHEGKPFYVRKLALPKSAV